MQTLAQRFLTPEEQRQVTRHVQEAERRTSGEIVPMVVSESHSYPLAIVIGALFFGLPTSLLATRLIGSHLWLGPNNVWLFLACFALLYTLFFQLLRLVPQLKRFFLLPSRTEEEVRAAATAAFFTERLYRTRSENGILLYISVFEHRVWILADGGINAKIPRETWQEIVEQVTDGIKNKRQGEALCRAITRIGTILSEHFPIEADDRDELHNLIIR